uniref:Uncharacterized protein n=1 Tax=Picea glauca TaxID=3330 RepID=A0A117NG72_PICGL|nr:hypothetical protein ABT39_MTgene1482 [Picea glauca]
MYYLLVLLRRGANNTIHQLEPAFHFVPATHLNK